MDIEIPGKDMLNIRYLLCDYNGTLAEDGEVLDGVKERFEVLAEQLDIIIITADTHGTVREMVSDLPCKVHVIGPFAQDEEKKSFLVELGAESTITIGNGFNDRLILQEAAVGIGLIMKEGAAVQALLQADVVCKNILDALDLLIIPSRLIATLRN